MKCVVCGCTDARACEGGCEWAGTVPPICTGCRPRLPPAAARLLESTYLAKLEQEGVRSLSLIIAEREAAVVAYMDGGRIAKGAVSASIVRARVNVGPTRLAEDVQEFVRKRPRASEMELWEHLILTLGYSPEAAEKAKILWFRRRARKASSRRRR